ncbi:unnamed protein product [Ambrosiozyma monospora]|uniref:Unnamed protein product n=1 Tax=Ambrosiozyma monospora TaxID=43982 RepID=A0A9W7DHF3_AMBMO|nr:unnamed protein product [Ambrosiozyma monospora]
MLTSILRSQARRPNAILPLTRSFSRATVRFNKINSNNQQSNPTPTSQLSEAKDQPLAGQRTYNFAAKLDSLDKELTKDQDNQQKQHQEQQNHEQQSKEDEEKSKTYEIAQKIQYAVAGIAVLTGAVVALEIMNNWSYLKYKFIGGSYDLSHFDEYYEGLQEKKQKKKEMLDDRMFHVTDPNDSSVPGVYICGSNLHGLVEPPSDEPEVNDDPSLSAKKSSKKSKEKKLEFQTVYKRIPQFDNFLVNDICLSSTSATLIDSKGDLYQWGQGYSPESLNSKPKPTIKGQKLVKAQISNGTVYALSKSGQVIYFPESKSDQVSTIESSNSFFNSLWLGKNRNTNEKPFQVLCNGAKFGKVADIAAGAEHLVLLNSEGQVFVTATGKGVKDKSLGQFGLPQFSQFDKPPKPNRVYEVTLLNKFRDKTINGTNEIVQREIKKIAAGDYFTVCLDSLGSIWAFGKNTYGAIGQPTNYDSEIISYPCQVNSIKSHFKKGELAQCLNVAAGGDTAFASLVASDIYKLFEEKLKDSTKSGSIDLPVLPSSSMNSNVIGSAVESQKELSHFAWGHGLKGELGVGHFVHGVSEPNKIKSLNGLKEYNEKTGQTEVMGVKNWSVGKNHVVVTLANGDVYCWGDNEYGQLGNGKRFRAAVPLIVPSLLEPSAAGDDDAMDGKKLKKKFTSRKANDRLNLKSEKNWEMVAVAGVDTSAIYYKKK